MSDRKNLVFNLLLAASLVLLASIIAAPNRAGKLVTLSTRSDNSRQILASASDQLPPRLSEAETSDTIPQVTALPSEEEEQDQVDAQDEHFTSLLSLHSFHKIPDRQPIDPRSILSLYPLRC